MTKNKYNQFEKRKNEHLILALKKGTEAYGATGLNKITLIHEALPNINFKDIKINTQIFGYKKRNPFLVSSMTGGIQNSKKINEIIAEASQEMDWFMGVGSQRRELTDPSANNEWINIKKKYSKIKLLSNIGITQITGTKLSTIKRLVEPIDATALFIHTNPLQECLQQEGTPNFKGTLSALEKLCMNLNTPIILKETGCGFSSNTLHRLNDIGIYAVDISGYGGTHWGRIEGIRNKELIHKKASSTFSTWGIPTIDSLMHASTMKPNYKIWASGGVRTGLDAAKMIALGAEMIGFAKPILKCALENTESIVTFMRQIEFEFKIALFCTGYDNINTFQHNNPWVKI